VISAYPEYVRNRAFLSNILRRFRLGEMVRDPAAVDRVDYMEIVLPEIDE